jgi:hypothetical protein
LPSIGTQIITSAEIQDVQEELDRLKLEFIYESAQVLILKESAESLLKAL